MPCSATVACPSHRSRLRLKRTYLVWFSLVVTAWICPLWAETTYSFTGQTFTSVEPPYTLDNRISGTFTVAIPLPPFMPLTDISALVTDYSFFDGQQTRTPGNSDPCLFRVGTDGAGHIVRWSLSLRQSGIATGLPLQVMDIDTGGDQVGSGPAPVIRCEPFSLTTASFNQAGGTWSDTLPSGQPTTYTFAGANFTDSNPPYTNAMALEGSFQVGNPLPPLMPLTDMTPALTDLSFFDGIQTRTLANTEICEVSVATDAAGHIVDWVLQLRQRNVVPGNPQQTIDSSTFGDLVGQGDAENDPCSTITLDIQASTGESGVWTDPLPTGTVTTYSYMGKPFSSITPPYLLTDFVSGFLRFSNPLPPYLARKEVGFAITDFRFEDRIQTRQPSNSALCRIEISTDGNGNILLWTINLRETPHTPNQPQAFLDVTTLVDSVGSGNAGVAVCELFSGDIFGVSEEPGLWTDPIPPPTAAVYFYRGSPYATATSGDLLGKKLSGRITLPGALPALLPLTDISEHVMGFEFRDTLQVSNMAHALICSMEVSTDENANIVQWRITLRDPIVGGGQPQHSMTTIGLGTVNLDQVGEGSPGATPCSRLNLTLRATANEKGSWSRFCPAQLAALTQWPNPSSILDLLQVVCP